MGPVTARMLRLTVTLSLLLLLLHQGEAVSSCLTCVSGPGAIDTNCTAGNTNVKRMKCATGMTEGCLATVTVTLGKEAWARSCCGSGACLNQHENIAGNTVDIVSCNTDNCNTMYPRKAVSSCLTCASAPNANDANCKAGNDKVPRKKCLTGFTEGCLASVTVTGGKEAWSRVCCGKGTCLNQHEEVAGVKTDSVSCNKDNCNTMDPRKSSGSVTTSLPTITLLFATLSLLLMV